MAWNRNTGGRNQDNNRGPWGNPTPPSGGDGGRRGDQPPDLEEILRRSQDRLRKMFPRSAGGGPLIVAGLGVIFLIWLGSGFYQVPSNSAGVVQRFGAYAPPLRQPGLQWRVPWPVETYKVVPVSATQIETIGGEADPTRTANGTDESLMLTGDRNFLQVSFVVRWRVKDAKAFAFNVRDPGTVVRTTAQSAMREVVGRGSFDQLQTGQRTATEEEVKRVVQAALDAYNSGVEVIFVNLQGVDPPPKALEAARDVQTAGQQKETRRNQAEAYSNNIVPTARGQAQQIIQDAQGYKQKVIADATGESARFLSVYDQYKKAPDVTRRRMYLETLEGVLGGMNKVIIDKSAQGGVVPYLPLGELSRAPLPASNPPAGPVAQPSGGN